MVKADKPEKADKKEKKEKVKKEISKDEKKAAKREKAPDKESKPKDKKEKGEKKEKKEKAEKSKPKEKRAQDATAADPPAKKAKADEAAGQPKSTPPPRRQSPRLAAAMAAGAVPELDLNAASSTLSADAYRKHNSIAGSTRLPDPIQNFKDAPFDKRLIGAFTTAGFTTPSPIQAQAWPVALSGVDLIAVAKTGSGKTVGFLLPAFNLIQKHGMLAMGDGPLALVMAPTRELAQQIHSEAERFGNAAGIRAACVYGGAPKGPQIGLLSRGRPALLVGTPGRLNDLLQLASPPVTNLDKCTYLVLDEADRMLDMGFEPQIKSVVARLPEHQTLFFTATWPKEVKSMAQSYLKDNAVQVFIGGADDKLVANKAIVQRFRRLHSSSEKSAVLQELIAGRKPGTKVVVFCNTKAQCEQLGLAQRKLGVGSCAIHGDKDQWEREKALQQFSKGQCELMFATDVAARGLDVKDVGLVINFDMPMGDDGVESYVHRIGRTGRAGANGEAITLWVDSTDKKQAKQLAKLLRDAGQEVPDFIDALVGKGG
eukprot:CAMPEP_0195566200 /NCGR_PEP_ID=MMETSP0814-20130614/922_1 /TAXON_ID=97485 /ORGANISM="Prymnesium parvum, Strain Texoma1" /LENGTH=541 /DNA_ID=CAMNT_0040701297 /DNA_START=26 /DNA_END=1647 /DNA_ORIENTATION=-